MQMKRKLSPGAPNFGRPLTIIQTFGLSSATKFPSLMYTVMPAFPADRRHGLKDLCIHRLCQTPYRAIGKQDICFNWKGRTENDRIIIMICGELAFVS